MIAWYLYIVGALLSYTIFTLSWADEKDGKGVPLIGRAAFTVLWPILAPITAIINLIEFYTEE